MIKANVKIRGTAPLLQHRYPDEAEDKKSIKKTGRADYSLEAEDNLFRGKDGVIYEPSDHIEGCMRKSAVNFQITGRGKKTYKDLVLSSIVVTPEQIPLTPQEYTIDKRNVIINRSRVSRYRPRWDEWGLEFTVKILDAQFAPEVVKEILEYGGAAIGIGDYRPKFGRFEVTSFEVDTS
jgi:hypothetical protein